MRLREILLGPSYFYHKKLIEKSKLWSEKKIKKYLRRKGPDSRAQILDKPYYTTNLESLSNFTCDFLVKKVRTGGTTGTPFVFYMDRFFRRQKERAYIFDIWSDVGYKPFDLRVIFKGNVSSKLISYSWFENAYYISASLFSIQTANEVLNFLKNIKTFYFHVCPSSLISFIHSIGSEEFSKLKIKGVLAGSEAFPSDQIYAFEKKFSVPVAHWYGHSEYAVLAKYCKSCDGFHFYPTYGYVEFLGDDSEVKSIVATSYNKIGTIFTRYDTQDLAIIKNVECGMSFPSIQSVIGRKQEFFYDENGAPFAFGPYFFGIHGSFWEKFQKIQFRQKKLGVLNVYIVTEARDISAIKSEILRRFPKTISFEFEIVESITCTSSGKHRYFICDIDKS